MPALPPYPINLTDQNPSRTVTLQDGKYYGSDYPTTQVVPSDAIGPSNMPITLYGRNTPRYGERVQENMVYMLENFASAQEPAFPVGGQLWFDRSGPGQLKVFNQSRFEFLTSNFISATTSSAKFQVTFAATPDEYTRLLGLVGKKITVHSPGAVYNPLVPPLSPEIYVQATINSGGVSFADPIMSIVLDVFDASLTTVLGWFMGGWQTLLQGAGSSDNLDALGFRILNLANPSSATDATNKTYVDNAIVSSLGPYITSVMADSLYADVAGDTMTGFLTLHADPTAALHAATKQYVDAHTFNSSDYYDIIAADATFVKKSGSTMTGFLELSADPIDPLQATTKQYVDNLVSSVVGGALSLGSMTDVGLFSQAIDDVLQFNGTIWTNTTPLDLFTNNIKPLADGQYIRKDGGAMTNFLTLHADPTANLHAATKQYADGVGATAVVDATAIADDTDVISGSFDEAAQSLKLDYRDATVVTIPFAPIQQNFYNKIDQPLARSVFATAASATSYDLSPMTFRVGFNRLAIFAAGLKLVASDKANATVSLAGSFLPTSPTGLSNSATVYDFAISENGGSLNTISVTGSSAQTFADLVDQINLGLAAATMTAKCELLTDGLRFHSAIGGTTSAITVTEAGATTPLFSALSPAPSSTSPWVSTAISSNYDYYELGALGETGSDIVFHVAPPDGTRIEALANYDF